MKKNVVFDFDDTIIYGNSYKLFIFFLIEQYGFTFAYRFFITYIKKKFGIIFSLNAKEIVLSQFKGKPYSFFLKIGNMFYKKYLCSRIFSEAIYKIQFMA